MKNEVCLIGNSHIDIVWQWRWQDGFQEIRATFKSVLDRMKEFENFKFTCAGALYYEWIEQIDSDMFSEIQKRIKEGRWCIAGGWYLQSDCNIPCGESFVREGLISQNYFKEKFGVVAKVGYNVDSFGHISGLPQILSKCGLDYYVFMRPDENEMQLPSNLFRWTSDDGSSVLAYRIPLAYGLRDIEAIVRIKLKAETENLPQAAFFGMGNHGGGPTIKLLTEIEEMQSKDDSYYYGTINEFFKNTKELRVPVVTGDLQFHSKGCYSLSTMIKGYNRKAEQALLSSETFLLMAEKLLGFTSPAGEFDELWKKLFFCHFHDNLAGTVIKPAAEDIRNAFGTIIASCDEKSHFALSRISWEIDTLQGESETIFREDRLFPFVHEKLGSPVVVFNSLPFSVKQTVTIYPQCGCVLDYKGNIVPSQKIRGCHTDATNVFSTMFLAEIPPCGYKLFRIFKDERKKTENRMFFGDNFIENNLLKVEFDKTTGCIKNITDKKTEKQLLSESAFITVIDDEDNDMWAHGVKKFDNVLGTFQGVEMHIIERGPARVTMRITSKYNGNLIRQDVSLLDDCPTVNAKVRVNFNEKHRMLKFGFPVNANKNFIQALSDTPFSVTERPCNGEEFPCGKWIAVTDKDSGVVVCNDGKYSFSVDGNIAYLSILRTAIYLDHYANVAKTRDEFCDYVDLGETDFSYTIEKFDGIPAAIKSAYSLNTPVKTVMETFHKGKLCAEYTGIEVDKENVIITALKKAQDGNGMILRLYETDGIDVATEINVFGKKFFCNLAHNEIKTLRITENSIKETNLLEDDL